MHKTTTLIRLRRFLGRSLPLFVLLAFSVSKLNAQYINGNLGTGTLSKSGVAAPAGTQWHEMQNDAGNNAETNVSIAFDNSIGLGTSSRVADDFTVPTGQIWNISKMTFYAVVLPPPPGTSPVSAVRVIIRDGSPAGVNNIVYGDLTTNRLSATSFSNIYTIANSQVPPPGTVPNQNFVVWKVEAAVTKTLTAGTYWIEWQFVGTPNSQRVFALMSQPVNARTVAGYNALGNFQNAGWTPEIDGGNPASAPDVPVDFTWRIDYTNTGVCVNPTVPTITTNSGNTTPCVGTSTTLTATGTLNSATNWFWYTGSCGGTPAGSGTSITVSPAVTTTYYVRGEPGCAAGGPCASITLNPVSGSTAAVLSQAQIAGPPVNLINETLFTTVPPAGGWFVQNNSVPIGSFPNWFKGVAAVFPANSGLPDSYAAANFQATTGTNTISEWMLTPSVAMKNGDKFSFYTRTTNGAFPDRLQIRLSTNGNSTNVGVGPTGLGDFTTLLLDINPTYTATGYPTSWTQYTITMSGLPPAGIAGGRLAFRYFVENGGPTGANSDYIGVDDVLYTTLTQINPTTCTGSTANLVVNITGGTSPYTVVIGANPATPGFPKTINNYVSGTNIPVTPAFTTTYNLISVTSAAGCPGTGNSGTPTITVSPTPVTGIQIQDQPTGPLCAGNPKLLTVVGAGGPTPFTNPTPISIPSGPGTATPSPATLLVSGLPTSGVSVTSVGINNFSHTWSGDVNIVLQHPNGTTNVILKADSQADPFIPASNVTLTFSDAAAASLPASGTLTTGTYKPTNRNGSPFAFLAPGPTVTGPTFPASPTLSTFTGDMNGTWKLFVEDRVAGDQGSIAGGYTITFDVPSTPPVGYTFLWSPAAGLSSTTGNPVAASPMSTTTYQVLGTAPSGCQTTAQITITVLPLPAVTQNPSNVTACGGSTVTFTGAGSGAGITYQWQVSTNGGVTYTNVTNGAPYSGATTTTLTINPVTFAMNGYRYRLVVSGTCPPAANSTGAILTVLPQPTITITPAGPVCGGVPGISGTKLKATGASTYTWSPAAGLFTNATATIPYVAGATADSVYAAPAAPTTYTVTGTDATTGCTNTATVIVNFTPPPPVITPNPVAMCLGDAAVRLINASNAPGSCVVSSGPINILIPDNPPLIATTHTLAVNCVPIGATVTGISVTLSVPNHTYDADLSINLKAPNGTILNLFRNMGATGGTNTTYPNTGIVNLTLSSASALSLATANTPAVGTLTGTYKADLINGIATPFYTQGDPPGFTSTATAWNQLYSQPNGNWTIVFADDGAGDFGNLTNWSIKIDYTPGTPTQAAVWSPATFLWLDQAQTLPYIAGSQNDTVYTRPTPAGVYTYNVTVNAIVAPPVFTNPAPIIINDGTTASPSPATIVVANLPTTNVSVKSVTLNGFSHTWAGDVNIVLQHPNGTTNVILKGDSQADPFTTASNATLTFSDAAAASIPNAGAITTGTYKPTNRNGSPFAFLAPGPTVTGPTFPASPTLSTFTGNMNGTWKLFVEDRVFGDQGSISGGYSIAFNDANPGCTSPPRVVTVTVNNPIVVTVNPVPHTICTNGTTSFTVTATGTNVTYQWQVSTDGGNTWTNIANNANYSGVTTNTLTITNPPVAWNGYIYRAVINGAVPCPSVNSGNAVLTVNPLPTITITASLYRNLLPGLTTSLFATSTPAAATYTWFRNGVPVPGGTVNPLVVNIDGLGTYSVRIVDVNGCVNTSGTIVIGDSTSGRVWIYPNPTTGQFGVRYNPTHNNVIPRGVNVFDAMGQKVWSKRYTLGLPFSAMNVDLSNLGAGTYWVEVTDADDQRLAMGRVVVAR